MKFQPKSFAKPGFEKGREEGDARSKPILGLKRDNGNNEELKQQIEELTDELEREKNDNLVKDDQIKQYQQYVQACKNQIQKQKESAEQYRKDAENKFDTIIRQAKETIAGKDCQINQYIQYLKEAKNQIENIKQDNKNVRLK